LAALAALASFLCFACDVGEMTAAELWFSQNVINPNSQEAWWMLPHSEFQFVKLALL